MFTYCVTSGKASGLQTCATLFSYTLSAQVNMCVIALVLSPGAASFSTSKPIWGEFVYL